MALIGLGFLHFKQNITRVRNITVLNCFVFSFLWSDVWRVSSLKSYSLSPNSKVTPTPVDCPTQYYNILGFVFVILCFMTNIKVTNMTAGKSATPTLTTPTNSYSRNTFLCFATVSHNHSCIYFLRLTIPFWDSGWYWKVFREEGSEMVLVFSETQAFPVQIPRNWSIVRRRNPFPSPSS